MADSTKDNEEKIKKILKDNIDELIKSLSEDFERNYNKKENNWILGDFDETRISNLVFVSSFESKSGNMMEDIATEIAKIKFGINNVPMVIPGRGINKKELEDFEKEYILDGKKSQVIISKADLKDCKNFASRFREDNRGTDRHCSSLDQEGLNELISDTPSLTKTIISKPVDLIYLDGGRPNLCEIKAGGDLDSSNAPGNIDKMFTWVCMLGKECNLYFATLYNKDGEGNLWRGGVKKYLGNNMILIGKEFWERILPNGVSFNKFKQIYLGVCKEANLNKKMSELIESVIKKDSE